MKPTAIWIGCWLATSLQLLPAHGDVETAFEKALYDKARYQTLSRLNDQDFVAYCVTMNLGGETLLRIHDEVMARQAERQNLIDEGQTNDSPKVAAIDIELKILGTQYAIKIGEARKGLEIEANIADSTLSALSQTQK